MHRPGVDPRYVQYPDQYGHHTPAPYGAYDYSYGVDPRANYAPHAPHVASQPDPRVGGGYGYGGYGAVPRGAPGSSRPHNGGEAGAYSATRQGVWTAGGHYSGTAPPAPTTPSSQVRAQNPSANPMTIAQPQGATRKEQSLQRSATPVNLRVRAAGVGRTPESVGESVGEGEHDGLRGNVNPVQLSVLSLRVVPMGVK